jgi:hypothetical protein
MKKSKLFRISLFAALILVAVIAVTMINSVRFNPDPSHDSGFIARAQRKSVFGITVSASALGPRESRRSFGENLAKYNIQPLWLSIENETDEEFVFIQIATDPDYFSPYEVSYRFRGAFSFAANQARDKFFLERQIASILKPHSRTTGFMYGVLDAGIKYARILVASNTRLETFDFALPVPGPAFVGTSIAADSVYPVKTMKDLDLISLREALAQDPCCATNADATRDGDPLNFVVVEGKRDAIVPFAARGWHLAQKLSVGSAMETARAFIFRDEYLTSPVSPLYLFGRREDLVIQKARSTINERVHARFWLIPYTFESRRIWMGQVSRDIGVRLTDQTWNLTTHKIAPDVDFDRSYLLQDLLMSGLVERYGFVQGVRSTIASSPRTNLTGDPYYTDGLRAVVFLSDQTILPQDIKRLPWETPQPLREEAQ